LPMDLRWQVEQTLRGGKKTLPHTPHLDADRLYLEGFSLQSLAVDI
jgi:hypothetical protein